jgi:hypothetical protein
MNAVLDLFNVLHEPTPVFERLREKPRWLVPLLINIALLMVLTFVLRPYYIAAFQGMAGSMPPEQAARMPSPQTQAMFGVIFTPLVVFLGVLAGAGLLWVAGALSGAEARYNLMLSVLSHTYVTFVLYSIVAALVLMVRGVESVSGMDDLRPALGLDLVAPEAGRFLGAFLNGINPFSIWGVWLTGVGVSVTHRTSRGTGMTVAAIAYLIALAISAALQMLQAGPR